MYRYAAIVADKMSNDELGKMDKIKYPNQGIL